MSAQPCYIIDDPDTFDLGEGTGYFPFDDMLAAFQPKAEQLEVIVRPGHDGESTRLTGVRAEPTPMLTQYAVVDRAGALNAIEAYQALIDGNPYEIVQHGESFGYFKILKASPRPLIPIAAAAGYINASATILLVIDWIVVSTFEPEEP